MRHLRSPRRSGVLLDQLTHAPPNPPVPPLASRELLVAAAAFLALTIVATYPQIATLTSHVGTHYDALFSIWRLAWIAHQLPRDPVHLFDANIFYPDRNTLAFSDALLLPGLIGAPFIWAGVSPVTVYNLLVVASFVSAGVAMYAFVRALTGSRLAGAFSGVIFAFQSYRFAHYAQLELLWTCWIPLALWAFERTLQSRRRRDAALLGVSIALQAWSCLYYAVFLVTGLGVLAAVRIAGQPREYLTAMMKQAIVAIATCAVLVAPYAVPYIRSRGVVGTRSPESVAEWSPTLVHYLATVRTSWLYGELTGHLGHIEGTLFPGAIALALAIAGVFAMTRLRQTLAYVCLLVIAFDLSLGFNGFLYPPLYEVAWPYQGLRVPARMFAIVSAALTVLAGFGFAYTIRRVSGRAARVATAAALIGVAFVEGMATPLELVAVERKEPVAYAWLARQPPSVLLEWPVPEPDSLGLTRDPDYMFYSLWHWQKLVNGYSGFHPPNYIRMLEVMRKFPEREAFLRLERNGVRFLMLHSEPSREDYERVRERLQDRTDVKLLIVDHLGSEEIALYELPYARQTLTGDATRACTLTACGE